MPSNWNNAPYAGEVWKCRKDGKTETRFVIDRTLGGKVLYRSGRWTHFNKPIAIDYNDWINWQAGAKLVGHKR